MPSEISKQYLPDFKVDKISKDFKPRSVVLETTFQCNMRCGHCGTSCGPKKNAELTLNEHYQLADELIELGIEEIFLSGGEALMNPDWINIAKKYDSAGVRVILLTNGLLIPKKIEEIKKSPLNQIAISIDGLEKTHEKIRGVKGSYKNALNSIKLLLSKTNIVPSVITTVSKWNIDELEKLYLEIKETGNTLWQIQRVFPAGRMDRDFILDYKEVEHLHKFIHQKRALDKEMLISGACDATPFSQYNVREIGDNYYGCPAGLTGLGIEADGNVKGCLTLPDKFIEGNVKEKSITEIWNDPMNFSYNRYFHDDQVKEGCSGCSYLEQCRCGCVVQAFSEAGDRYDQLFCLHSSYFKKYQDKNKIIPLRREINSQAV